MCHTCAGQGQQGQGTLNCNNRSTGVARLAVVGSATGGPAGGGAASAGGGEEGRT